MKTDLVYDYVKTFMQNRNLLYVTQSDMRNISNALEERYKIPVSTRIINLNITIIREEILKWREEKWKKLPTLEL